MNALKAQFHLDPNIYFLNHGSFGATPKPILDTFHQWITRLEQQPVKFLGREIGDLLADARRPLADYLNVEANNVAYIPNATFGANIVARSLDLGPNDEVVTSDHEYGACVKVWQFLSRKKGFDFIQQPTPLTFSESAEMVDALWQAVTARTKVIFLSHITSSTAVTNPVAEICARARAAGILTIIDGAHAPGQIDLNLTAIGADFYFGNAHKWLCAPKGAAFLYARPEVQSLIEPLVVSWGWGDDNKMSFGSPFLDYLQWPGTNSFASYLSVPAALQFQADHDWSKVRQRCHTLLADGVAQIEALTGLPSAYASEDDYRQLAVVRLPRIDDLQAFKNRLYDEFHVEIPCTEWNGQQFVRISVQGYNTAADIDALVNALHKML